MKRLLTILLICFTSITLFAQKGKTDQIVKTNGFIIKANVLSIKGDMITYQLPDEPYAVQIKKTEIQKIIYDDGKIVEFSKVEQTDAIEDNAANDKSTKDDTPPLIIEEKTLSKEDLDSSDWVDIVVTEDPEEVKGLIEVGSITGNAEGNKINTSSSVLTKIATVDLKKEAALLHATIVLINETEQKRDYGELPELMIKGTAYKKE